MYNRDPSHVSTYSANSRHYSTDQLSTTGQTSEKGSSKAASAGAILKEALSVSSPIINRITAQGQTNSAEWQHHPQAGRLNSITESHNHTHYDLGS